MSIYSPWGAVKVYMCECIYRRLQAKGHILIKVGDMTSSFQKDDIVEQVRVTYSTYM